jgi:hypothetical protein
MNATSLFTRFSRIGARLKVTDRPSRRFRVFEGAISLDVREDREGEFFEVAHPPGGEPDVLVLDAQPADRHLLLLVRQGSEKQKFLCGHDERHWFVAALPESAPVGTVRQAKEALKPAEVLTAQARQGLRARARNRRKNAAFRRQGEWFFLPVPQLHVDGSQILRNEPLVRVGGGKPHMMEFCYRAGGEAVYVCPRRQGGVTAHEYHRLLADVPEANTWGWRLMRRNPDVFVRGRARHADHKTIVLRGWHQVFMNTEGQSRAMRSVAFLD